MPPKKSDTPKGLIGALVGFVLLSIILGVTTYLGFSDQAKLEKDKKTAEQAEKVAKASREWEQFQNLLLQSAAGIKLTKEQEGQLQALRDQYNSGNLGKGESQPDQERVAKLVQELDQEIKWDPDKKQAALAYRTQINTLKKQLADTQALLDKSDKEHRGNVERLTKDLAASQQAQEELNKSLADAKKALTDEQSRKADSFLALTKQVETTNEKDEKIQKDTEATLDDAKKKVAKLETRIKELTLQIKKLKDKIEPENLIDYEKPRGQIVMLDRNGNTAYVSIGSADNARPRLTFSIFSPNAGLKSKAMRKGALEIVDVREPHLSKARIIDVTDPNETPIVVGDQLFNPAWNPGVRKHVALAGLMDLTGEGHDDSRELINNLQRQGIVVDAYMDLKTHKIVGKVTSETEFLVKGDEPTFDISSFLAGTVNPNTEFKKEVVNQMGEMQSDAQRLGTQIIPLRRFLTLIGYPLPRVYPGSEGAAYQHMVAPPKPSTDKGAGKDKEPADKDLTPDKGDKDEDKPAPKKGGRKAPPKPGKPEGGDQDAPKPDK